MPRTSSSQQTAASTVLRYVLAVLLGILAVVFRQWLTPYLGDRNLYHTAWVAVVVSAWYCGLGPSIATTLIVMIGVWHWLLPIAASDRPLDGPTVWGMVGFAILSALIVALGEANRRAREKQEITQTAFRESQQQLHAALQDRTAEVEHKTAQVIEQAKLIDLANDAIWIRTPNEKISYWNQGAERLYGWTAQEAVGKSPVQLLRTKFPVPFSEIIQNELWQGELIQTKRDGSYITVASRWTTLRDKQGELAGWLEINTDITARKQAEDAARRLSGRILNLQDAERRRIARELHDSLGQYLAVLKMNLDMLSMSNGGSQQTELLAECAQTVERCLNETRTLSHLLHPPLLDEAGFVSAARWYAEGLAQRSGIEVNLSFPNELGRLSRDLETVLFRTLQEALTNVHRHSGGSIVDVLLQVDAEQVRMEIKDNGRGMPEELVRRFRQDGVGAGVGLAGMRERVREVAGSLVLLSGPSGTSLTVTIPLTETVEPSSDSENETSRSNVSAA